MAPAGACRFDDLGRFQFDRLCRALIDGVDESEWRTTPTASVLVLPDGVEVPADGPLPRPALVVGAWGRSAKARGEAAWIQGVVANVLDGWRHAAPRSILLLTNVSTRPSVADVHIDVLDADALKALVLERPEVRLRVPSLLGVVDGSEIVAKDVAARSTADLEAAIALARVFVPTRAYTATLGVLQRFGFAVLTGPPEMGKTAIARMIGLAKASAGWELHECIHPDQLWERHARDRAQVFVADDAFGSTEYRPEAAARWAVELDRVLRAMDERHWLIWTSRPTPLKAGLRRIQREHGVERFPQPAQVQVDAGDLEIDEKALILFRHAKAAHLSEASVRVVRINGWRIVSHDHFTPERIRRFVAGPALRSDVLVPGREEAQVDQSTLEELIAAEIREPTTAMAASFRALGPAHRALLVAMLDVPPGPVHERDLAAAVRRHSSAGFAEQPSALLDRLSDHFVRVSANETVTWVHPSWRDLVIDELASSPDARQSFLRASSIDGLLLALSTGGGRAGTRSLPLLAGDRDWDAVGDLVTALGPELDEPSATRLLVSLGEALESANEHAEVEALATLTLQLLARRWNERREAIPVGLLGQWLELRSRLGEQPLVNLAPTWIEHLPSATADPAAEGDVAELDEWLTLAALLSEHAPAALDAFGFPRRQYPHVTLFLERVAVRDHELPNRHAVIVTLGRIVRLMPDLAERARSEAVRLAESFAADPQETYVPRRIPPELQQLVEPQGPEIPWDERLVVQVLRDL